MKYLYSLLFIIGLANPAHSQNPINIMCVHAAGYYGGLSAKQMDSDIRIQVKTGLGLYIKHFLKVLKVETEEETAITGMETIFPVSLCKTSDKSPLIISCTAKNVDMKLYGDPEVENKILKFNEFSLVISQVEDVYRTTVSGIIGAHSSQMSKDFYDAKEWPTQGCSALTP